MKLTTPARTARRTTNARRPQIAQDLVKAGEACVALSSLMPEGYTVTEVEAVKRVCQLLTDRPAPEDENTQEQANRTNRNAIVDALVAYAHDVAVAHTQGEAAELARRAGMEGVSMRNETEQRRALGKLGIKVRKLDIETLRPYRRRIAIRLVERVRRAQQVELWVRSGSVRAALIDIYDTASTAQEIRAVVEAVTRAGLDGEMLLEAIINFEAGRHFGLVKQQANRLAASYAGYVAEDLFGFGWQGLRVALRAYDPTTFAFSTYACTRIVGNIQDGVRAESPIPKRLGTFSRKVVSIEEQLAHELGRPADQDEVAERLTQIKLAKDLGRRPTLAEVADQIEDQRNQMRLLPRLQAPASIDELLEPESPRSSSVSHLFSQSDLTDAVVQRMQRSAILEALEQLPDEEAEAVRLLEYEGMSPEEARRVTGANSRQLRARRLRGLQRLGGLLSEWAPAAG